MSAAPGKIPVIIDTDVDIDDWMAMLYLLNHPGIEVRGITVVGTGAAHLEPGTRNALDLLMLAGKPDVPVAKGLARPMRYHHAFPADIRDPVDRVFGITLPHNPNPPLDDALAFLRQQLTARGKKVTILAIGPLTNLGTLLKKSPELAQRIERLVIMGGSIDDPGNVHAADAAIANRVAEWNVYIDPVAADIVLRSGAAITLVPLDATQYAPITNDFYLRLLENRVTPSANFVYQALTADYPFLASGDFDFWDPLAAGILTDGTLGTARQVRLEVVTADNDRSGQLLVREDGAPVEAYFDVVAQDFEDLFLNTLNGEKVPRSEITFLLDGELVTLDSVSPQTLLIDYLQQPDVGKGGTKLVCGQGGCGACTVMLTTWDLGEGKLVKRAVNSCLRPLAGLDGAMITTVQGIGSVKTAVDEVQHKIAANNGSQCGYCTPGFTMNMFTLRQNHPELTEREIEEHFDGNICRCTGYRPILGGFKQFAVDYQPPQEPMPEIRIDPNFKAPVKPFSEYWPPEDFVDYMKHPQPLALSANGYTYARPVTLEALYRLKAANGPTGPKFRLLCGNTSIGIYGTRPIYAETALDPHYLVDISALAELQEVAVGEDGVTVGGAVTLSRLIEVIDRLIAERDPVETRGLAALGEHLRVVANLQVRNEATVAGNVHLATNLGFLSDVVLSLATVGATVTVSHAEGEARYPILDLPRDTALPKDAIYRSFHLPWSRAREHFQTFKIRRRNEDSHAIVNAGFMVRFDSAKRVKECRIVYNGIAADYALEATVYGIPFHPITMPKTRAGLIGRSWDEKTLRWALKTLAKEVEVYAPPSGPGRPLEIDQIPFSYRASLAETLFYKFFVHVALAVAPRSVPPPVRSAGETPELPLSSGQQYYNSYPAELPVSSPLIKLSAFLQATGEATYTHDIPCPPGTLQAAYVYSLVPRGTFHYVLPMTTAHGDRGQRVSAVQLDRFLVDWFRGTFVRLVTYGDIAAENQPANWVGMGTDDPIFVPSEDQEVPASILAEQSDFFRPMELTSIGAPIALVVAEEALAAAEIADFVRTRCIRFQPLFPVYDFDRALADRHFYPESPTTNATMTHIPEITRPGSNARWLAHPEKPLVQGKERYSVVSGTHGNGFQNHFYLETMGTLAVPGEDRSITLYTVTQTLADNQYTTAGILGLSANDVRVVLTRDGGAFGGRQTRSTFNSAATALAATVVNRPVRLFLDRATNFVMCGERHPFRGRYHVAHGDDGTLKGLSIDYFSNGGNTYDVSFAVMDFGVMSADNVYQVDTFKVTGNVCQTNQLSNTAFRSFGQVQSINILEEAIEKVAWKLGRRPEEIRERNFYRTASAVGGFMITDQTLGVLGLYGYDSSAIAALKPLRGVEFASREAFLTAVNQRTSAFTATDDRITLEDYSTTAYDYTPYIQPLPYNNIGRLWQELKETSEFEARLAAVEEFNRDNRWMKRGLSIIPIKYGVSYTDPRGMLNQGGAYIIAYSDDGSVLVQHGGVESGQGIQTKMAQIAAETLGIPLTLIKMGDTDTRVISDASPTAASTGSDLNGGAVQQACLKLRGRLEQFCQDLEQYTVYFSKFDPTQQDAEQKVQIETVTRNWRNHWAETWPVIVSLAYLNRIDLTAEARYKTPHYSAIDLAHPMGTPFFYFVEAAAVSEVEIDVLTGDLTVLRSDILFDLGKSLNPLLDVGQIEGGFVQGIGYLTCEELLLQGPDQVPRLGYPAGAITSTNTWDYKPPGSKSIPLDLRVHIVDNSGRDLLHPGPKLAAAAVKSSKGIGEPPLVLANSVFFAIKGAILAFYQQQGYEGWVEMEAPATVQRIQSACRVAIDDLRI